MVKLKRLGKAWIFGDDANGSYLKRKKKLKWILSALSVQQFWGKSMVKVYTVNSKQNNFLLCQVLLLIYQYPKYHDCC